MRLRSWVFLFWLLSTLAQAQSKAIRKGKAPELEPVPTQVAVPPVAVPPVAQPTQPAPPQRAVITTPENERPRLVVLSLLAQGVSAAQAAAFTDAIVSTLTERRLFSVVSSRDVETSLGLERQRQLLGVCDADSAACGQSLGDVLSAPFVVSGQLSRLGAVYQLTLQTLETTTGKAFARANRVASSLEELQRTVPSAAAEATGVPLPAPPSRVLSISLLTAGGLALLSGAGFGVVTLTRQQGLNDELCPSGVPASGRCTGTSLRPRSFYLAQNDQLAVQKWVSVGLLAAGAAVVVLGLVVMPPFEGASRLSATLVPSPDGLFVMGNFW